LPRHLEDLQKWTPGKGLMQHPRRNKRLA
jgi:hypothetical protein